MTATTMKYLRKYPKRPGAERFAAFYVAVEVVRPEEKVTAVPAYEFRDDPDLTALRGYPAQRRVQVGTKDYREAGFVVREAGKRPKWVPAAHVFDSVPAAR
jgi:hypothetical protein